MFRFACLTVIGCGAAAPPAIEHKVSPPAIEEVALPPIYAGLFVDNRTWTFKAETDYGTYDATTGHSHSITPGSVTCTITAARTIRGGRVAELDCNPTDVTLPQSPSGTYVGTAKGLWRVGGEFDDDVQKLDPNDMLLAATPTAFRREHKDDDRFGSAIDVIEHADGWCISQSSWGGDEGGWTLCLRAADGVIGGGGFFGGAATRDTYFGEAPRD